jgi:glutamine synthetase
MIQFALNRLPDIPKDNTDRNRTSPFAFTGNKFEFRAVGSSHAVSFPMTVLNASMAESMKEFTTRLRDKKKDTASVDIAVLEVAKEFFASSRGVHFEGDGYSQEWRSEAKRRGLPELLKTPEALKAFHDDVKNHKFLLDSGTYKKEEIDAIVEIRLERYVKHLDIEAQTLTTMVRQYVIPAAQNYQAQVASSLKSVEGLGVETRHQRELLNDLTRTIETTFEGLSKLQSEVKSAHEQNGVAAHATAFGEKVAPAMAQLRAVCDKLESMIADELWPLPKYREMLFIR